MTWIDLHPLGIVKTLVIGGLEVAAMSAIFRVAGGPRFVFIAVAGWLILSYMLSWLFSSYALNLEVGVYVLSFFDHLVYAVAFGVSIFMARAATGNASPDWLSY